MTHIDERSLFVGILLAVALLTTCFISTNEAPRFSLALALGNDGELAIDKYFAWVIHPAYNPIDYSEHNSRRFSDKGPLQSFLAAPVVRLLMWAGVYFETSVYLTTLLFAGLPLALTSLLILRFGRSVHRPGDVAPETVALAYAFCTPAFHYATMFYSSSLTSLLGFASFYLVALANDGSGRRTGLVAGALAGATGLNDYAALPVFPCLLAFCLMRAPRMVRPFLTSGLIVLSLLPLYQYALFGDPFMPTYGSHGVFTDVHSQGAYMGIGIIKPEAVFGLALGPSRGLFTISPLLIVAVVLWTRLHRRHPAAARLTAVIACALFVLQASFALWWAGSSFGPRYMVPAFPFLVLPLLTLRRHGRLWHIFSTFLVISFFLNLLSAASYPAPIEEENAIGSALERWVRGQQKMGRVPSTGELKEIIPLRPKVNLLLYMARLNSNEAIVRLPSILAGVIGVAMLRRSLDVVG